MPVLLKFLSSLKMLKISSLKFALEINLTNDLLSSENLLFLIF